MAIDDAMFDQTKTLVADLITLPQTIAIKGILGHGFRILAKAGFVHETAGMTIGGVWGPKYIAAEVQHLVDQLRASTDQAQSSGMKPVGAYANKNGISGGRGPGQDVAWQVDTCGNRSVTERAESAVLLAQTQCRIFTPGSRKRLRFFVFVDFV